MGEMMEEWPVGVEKFYRDHPLLADELKKADALCEEYLAVPLAGRRRRQSETDGAAEVQARGDDGEDVRLRVAAEAEVYGCEAARKRVALTEGERRGQDVSESVVKRAVGDKVVQELEARDEERAHRYVATVRSVVAALRYVWLSDDATESSERLQRQRNSGSTCHAATRTTQRLGKAACTRRPWVQEVAKQTWLANGAT
ncbi:hypothetical protein PF004_g14256 [Phytophthora fragariae]|uniref:Uncharacterized protein n=1 Tax=Phytophthora fragariae TaxID=53985 RepID=A0A6G0NPR6_9STRA|nr:hypothetical protein PF004_g14256 [Phytophthora fragariae]